MTTEQISSFVSYAERVLGPKPRSSIDYAEARRLVRRAQDRGVLPLNSIRCREIAREAMERGFIEPTPPCESEANSVEA